MKLAIGMLASALLAVATCAACSSSGSESRPTACNVACARSELSLPPRKHRAPKTYPTAKAATAASCRAIGQFDDDLARLTPRGSQIALVHDAQGALTPFLHTADGVTLSGPENKQYNDAVKLIGHVGSASWPTHGTPLDPQVENAESDCGFG